MVHDLVILLIPVVFGMKRGWRMVTQFFIPVAGLVPGFAFVSALPTMGESITTVYPREL
jgi:hypothetical protein